MPTPSRPALIRPRAPANVPDMIELLVPALAATWANWVSATLDSSRKAISARSPPCWKSWPTSRPADSAPASTRLNAWVTVDCT